MILSNSFILFPLSFYLPFTSPFKKKLFYSEAIFLNKAIVILAAVQNVPFFLCGILIESVMFANFLA